MSPEEVLELFRQAGALLEGHFLLTSGLHSDRYLQCALVLQHPRLAARLGEALSERLVALAGPADCVLAPALGGILVAHEVARPAGARRWRCWTCRRMPPAPARSVPPEAGPASPAADDAAAQHPAHGRFRRDGLPRLADPEGAPDDPGDPDRSARACRLPQGDLDWQ